MFRIGLNYGNSRRVYRFEALLSYRFNLLSGPQKMWRSR
jgi:hypothetical protein